MRDVKKKNSEEEKRRELKKKEKESWERKPKSPETKLEPRETGEIKRKKKEER